MSRLYEALRNAQTSIPAAAPTGQRFHPAAEDGPILRLAQAIDARLGDFPRRVIQVIACDDQEASGAVARRLARLSAVSQRRAVLLLNAANPLASVRPRRGHPAVAGLPALNEPPPHAAPTPDAPYAAGTLFDHTNGGIDPESLRHAWAGLRLNHDLIVIDSPPVSAPVGLALAPTVDGVVLVLQADKTRAGRAEAARDALLDSGANLLGVVLDNCRPWIPRIFGG